MAETGVCVDDQVFMELTNFHRNGRQIECLKLCLIKFRFLHKMPKMSNREEKITKKDTSYTCEENVEMEIGAVRFNFRSI